jgi:hypothetical protein
MNDTINISGTANLFSIGHNNGMGIVNGFVNGSSYGEMTGDPTPRDDGKIEAPGIHYFIDEDGSMIYTTGRTVMQIDPASPVAHFEAEYSVEVATGRFEGFGGTFTSRGFINMAGDAYSGGHGVGACRFSGQLKRI